MAISPTLNTHNLILPQVNAYLHFKNQWRVIQFSEAAVHPGTFLRRLQEPRSLPVSVEHFLCVQQSSAFDLR